MDWDTLRLVLALQRGTTLTAAAAELGVTRTTVGRRLLQVEEELGTRLFDRTPGGLLPTPAGEHLVRAAAAMEDTVREAEARVRRQDALLRGELRVTTVDFLFDGFPELFGSFVERHPGVALTVQAVDTQLSLRRREADVALRIGNAPAEHLVGRQVGRLQFELYAARSLLERVGLDAPLSALPWLHWHDRAAGAWLDQWLDAHAPGARVALRVDGYAAMRRAVQAGIGVHFLCPFHGDPDPGLVRLDRRLSEHARALWLLTLRELRQTARVRAFLDHAVARLSAVQSALDGSWDAGHCVRKGQIVPRGPATARV